LFNLRFSTILFLFIYKCLKRETPLSFLTNLNIYTFFCMCNKSLRVFATDRNFNSRRWFESTHAEMRSYHPRNSLHWELQDADRHLFKFHHLVHILVASALLYFYLFIGIAFMLVYLFCFLHVKCDVTFKLLTSNISKSLYPIWFVTVQAFWYIS